MLELKNVSVSYRSGGKNYPVIRDMTVKCASGFNAVLGPNGAGKTTLMKAIFGLLPYSGQILLDGRDLKPLSVEEKTKLISYLPQMDISSSNLTVLDNVRIGMHNKITYSNIDAVFRLPKYYQQERKVEKEAVELLKIFGLDDLKDLTAGNLPYGAQRRLEIARAMATEPKLLLLDEPAAGMNPQETEELMDMIRFVRDHFKISILLIEHDMKLVMGICELITVLNYGMMLAEGTPEEIQSNPQVIKAYLGE